MKRWLMVFSAMAITVSVAATLQITGEVVEASGDVATVKLEGALTPVAGDAVEIFFVLGGSEVSVASGKVTSVNAGSTKVKIEKATGTVEKGQLVRIHSSAAEKKPGPTSTAPPATAADGDEPEVARARQQYNAKDYDGAIATLSRLIEKNPTAMNYYRRAFAYRERGRYAEAIEDATKAIDLGYADLGEIYGFRAWLRDAVGDFAQAISDATKAIEVADSQAYATRGHARTRMDDLDGAIGDYIKFIELARSDFNLATVYADRGQCYQAQAKFAEAIADFEKAMQLDGSYRTRLGPVVARIRAVTNPTPTATSK